MIDQILQSEIEEILAQYRGFSPIDLAEHLGIKIQFIKDQDSALAGAIKMFPEGTVIFVNDQDNERRKLFTIAHELGHFFLHSDDVKNGIVSYRNSAHYQKYHSCEKKREEVANHFAAEMLMPRETFVAYFIKNSDTPFNILVKEMADFFFVNEAAIKIRLSYLDLI